MKIFAADERELEIQEYPATSRSQGQGRSMEYKYRPSSLRSYNSTCSTQDIAGNKWEYSNVD